MQRLYETIRRYAQCLIIYAFTVTALDDSWISTFEYSWDSITAQATCGVYCSNGTLVRIHDLCLEPICFDCDCDETCVVKGTCCPYEDGALSSKYRLMEFQNYDPSFDHFYNRLRCITHPLVRHAFFAAARCPKNWTDEAVKRQCEDPKSDSLAPMIPYFDGKIKIAYTNMFCLLCNGHDPDSKETVLVADYDEFGNTIFADEPRFQAWPLSFECKHYQNLFHSTDIYIMYLTALELGECKVGFKIPNGVKICPRSYEPQTEPEECTDKSSEAFCHDIPPFPGFSVSGFKNYFCFLCSGREARELPKCDCDTSLESFNIYPLIYMLFNASQQLHSVEDQPTTGCSSGYWVDGTGQCVPSSCSPGKELQADESCSTVLNSISGLEYDLHLVLTPDNIIHMGNKEEELVESMIFAINDRVTYSVAETDLTYSITRKTCSQNSTYYIRIVGSILGTMFMPRDVFEENLVEFVTTWNLTITDTEGMSRKLMLSLSCLGKDQCEIFMAKLAGGDNVSDCIEEVKNGALGVGARLERFPNLIDIRPDLVCPTVALAPSKDPEVVGGKFTSTAQIGNKEIHFTDISRFSFVNNKLLVCLDLLKKVYVHHGKLASNSASVSTNDIIKSVNYYLDIACIVVSCTCLVACIITYFMFPSMRSLPGRNNMCLCFSLLTAHLSLLITSLQGNSVSLEKLHCLVHAVILHYSWVASFLWMNSCCIDMFQVFTGHNFGDDRKKFVLYSLYSFGIPALVIATMIAIMAVATSGASWGYDDDICFLDTQTSSLVVILGVLSPLGLAVTINGVLFGVTIRKVARAIRLQKEKRSHAHVLVYCKLSTITGLFCLLAAAAVQFQTPLLSLLASPLAALQGILIFASFIANKRVGKMYLDLIRTSSTEQNTAATKSRSS